MTFSLLPDCLAARMPGTLEQAEGASKAAQQGRGAGSLEQRAELLRPSADSEDAIGLQAAVGWMKRRHAAVTAALGVVIALMPELCGGAEPTVTDVGRALGRDEGVLVELRRVVDGELARIPSPVGFVPRSATNKRCRRRAPSRMVSSGCEAGSLADKGVGPCKGRDETRGRSPP